MSYQSTEKAPKFHCQKCDFTCNKNSAWNRHIITAKHIGLENQDKIKNQGKIQFICNCGKTYADRSGLWRHSHKCLHNIQNVIIDETKEIDKIKETDLIQILINENRELKNLILELIKKESNTRKTNEKDINKIVNLNFILGNKSECV